MKLPGPRLRALVLATTLAGITDVAPGQSVPTGLVRDSAGVQIIEYATIKTSLPAFRVAMRLLADVGGVRVDSKDEIEAGTGFAAAIRFSDGRVAVAENYTVRILGPRGKFVRLVGGRGGGPGQFNSQIVAMCRIRGDSLVVLGGDRRVSLFDGSGGHVQTTTAEGYIASNCDSDGSLVASAPAPNQYKGKKEEEFAALQRYVVLKSLTREGRFADSIGVFAGQMGVMPYKIVEDRFDVGVYRDKLYADNGSEPEVKVYSRSGKLKSIIRWRDPLTVATPRLLSEIADGRVPTNMPASAHARQVAQLLVYKQRATLPAYSGFLVDHAGRLWVRDYWPTPRAGGWNPGYTVFSPDGTLLGRYELPHFEDVRSESVTDAGIDYVVVRLSSRSEGIRVVVQSISPAR